MRRAFALAVLVIAMAVGQSNVAGAGPFAGTGESPPSTTVPGTDAPTTTMLDNPFLPEEANIGDCVSALPRPECGSKARGGWRQTLVFAAVAVAIAVIGFRLVVAVRRRDRSAGLPT